MTFLLAAALVVRLPLVVRTYDSAGVASRTLDAAHASAGAILAAAGLEPVWRPCHASICGARPKPQEVEIRFVAAPPQSPQGTLGYAAVDVAERKGTLATIYVDRVEALAADSGVDAGELLGRAIAHEIGHLLLGTSDHARGGLMRATWKAVELRRDMPLDWVFSGSEGAEMRRRLAARAAGGPVEEDLVAARH